MPDYSSQLNQIMNALNHLAPTGLQQYLNIISALASMLAAFAALWAAYAASRAAGTAKQAAENVQKITRLEILRDVSAAAYNVIAECERVKSLAQDVKFQIKDLATHSGHNRNSSVVKEITEKAESKERELLPLQDKAKSIIEKRAHLSDMSEANLMHELSKLDGYLLKAQRVKYEMEREAVSLIAKNQVYFSKAISRTGS